VAQRPLTLGGALSYVGERIDRDFDLFPAPLVQLDAHLLASARVAYRITDQLEGYARVENGFDADYQDVVGYATPGRTVHAGIRLRFGN
jgi:vitamin B12 transporter